MSRAISGRYLLQEAGEVRRVRVEQRPRRDRAERAPVLSLDPRDRDVVRAKRLASQPRDRRA